MSHVGVGHDCVPDPGGDDHLHLGIAEGPMREAEAERRGELGPQLGPAVTEDTFHFLSRTGDFPLPGFMIPPQMKVPNAVIISLGELVKWLGEEAQALGIDIFPMTAAVDVLTGERGEVAGIITGDLGVDAAGNPKSSHAAGIALRAKYTLIGEGARGS